MQLFRVRSGAEADDVGSEGGRDEEEWVDAWFLSPARAYVTAVRKQTMSGEACCTLSSRGSAAREHRSFYTVCTGHGASEPVRRVARGHFFVLFCFVLSFEADGLPAASAEGRKARSQNAKKVGSEL